MSDTSSGAEGYDWSLDHVVASTGRPNRRKVCRRVDDEGESENEYDSITECPAALDLRRFHSGRGVSFAFNSSFSPCSDRLSQEPFDHLEGEKMMDAGRDIRSV